MNETIEAARARLKADRLAQEAVMAPIERLFERWLSGTTCYRRDLLSIFWLSDCGRYAVFHHKSHVSYLDRFSKCKTCRSFYVLVDAETQGQPDWIGRIQYLNEIEGRYNEPALFNNTGVDPFQGKFLPRGTRP